MTPGPNRSSQLRIQRLYGVRGVYDPADGLGECEERDDVFPIPPPALRNRRVFLAPFALLKGVERVPGGRFVGRAIDGPERAGDLLAVPGKRR